MRRLVILLPVLLAFQVGVQPALAWTWPVDGPVLRQFTFGGDPYAGGQHRGIDIGAPSGTAVRAPASGRVSFAGTVPGGGRTLTIETADGFSVTLVHLGTIGAARGAGVGEGDAVGTVGPSGEVDLAEPYVYLGIRVTADPNGYVDPLRYLPAPATSTPVLEPQPAADPAPTAAADEPGASAQAPQAHPSSGSHVPKGAATSPARPQHSRGRLHAPVDRPAIAVTDGRRAVNGRVLAGELAGPRARRSVSSIKPIAQTIHVPVPRVRANAKVGLSPWPLVAAALAACGAVAVLRLRRQLGDTGAAHGATPVLLEGVFPAAEDAGPLRLGEKDRLVLDGDLERILLAQPEPLPDLDRNHDSAQLVDVANDSRPRHSPRGSGRRLDRLLRSHRLRACPSIRSIGLSVPS
jgi:hypothetical protein